MLDKDKIIRRLRLYNKSMTVICLEETGSTSTDLKSMPESGEDVLITAERQTSGRGRQGKSFSSPEGGLYFSVLLHTSMPIEDAARSTSCAAVAVTRAIGKTTGADVKIKWINDIYAFGGKLCGILCEAVNDYRTMTTDKLIFGIGVNVKSSPKVSSDYKTSSLHDLGINVEREILCAEIVNTLMDMRDGGFDFSKYRNEYVSRSLVLGRKINYTRNGVVESAEAVDIDERGGLVVLGEDGRITLSSGEISVRLADQ